MFLKKPHSPFHVKHAQQPDTRGQLWEFGSLSLALLQLTSTRCECYPGRQRRRADVPVNTTNGLVFLASTPCFWCVRPYCRCCRPCFCKGFGDSKFPTAGPRRFTSPLGPCFDSHATDKPVPLLSFPCFRCPLSRLHLTHYEHFGFSCDFGSIRKPGAD